jgi:hypothetical protein
MKTKEEETANGSKKFESLQLKLLAHPAPMTGAFFGTEPNSYEDDL